MKNLDYYLSLLKSSYDDVVNHLLLKYGPSSDNYFSEESYNKFMLGVNKSISKKKITRTSEGLYCHHIDENKYQKMGDPNFIKRQKIPYESQKKDKLVFCNLIEHAVLHALITQETDGKFGRQGLDVFLLPSIHEWYIEEKPPTSVWERNCYQKAFLDPSEALRFYEAILQYINY